MTGAREGDILNLGQWDIGEPGLAGASADSLLSAVVGMTFPTAPEQFRSPRSSLPGCSSRGS